MKIISTGESWSEEYGCPDCKTQLQVDDNDVHFRRQRHSSIWGAHEDWLTDLYYVICPKCELQLKISDLPDWIQNKSRRYNYNE
jgi:hypothetical protein